MKKSLKKLFLICVMSIIALGASAEIDKDYLCFTANTDGSTVELKKCDSPNVVTLQYSTDKGESWTTVNFSSECTTGVIELEKAGDKVYFRNTNTAENVEGFSKDYNNCYYFKMSGSIAASGNVMSLVDYDVKTTKIPNNYCFTYLFSECSALTSAPALPATALADYCYYEMFSDCTSLLAAPALPATTLAEGCYAEMFYGCTSLLDAPALPATALADYCYYDMFCDCTSLLVAPALPAETLAEECYEYMFCDCTSLLAAPALPATTLAEGCYEEMFYGCTSLLDAPALPATALADYCYYDMFCNCTSLLVAPALPATTLAESCYADMFYGCTSLLAAPELPATTLVKDCYEGMFYGCSSLKYVKVGFTEWVGDDDEDFTEAWLSHVGTFGVFVCSNELATTYGTSYIPEGWTKLPCEALCFVANENGSKVKLEKHGNPTNVTLQYSTDGTTWETYTMGNDVELAEEGKTVFFRNSSSDVTGFSIDSENYYQFVMEGSVSSLGILESLICNTLKPQIKLGEYCFYNLFYGCEALTTAPNFFTTELAAHCYHGMFYGCTSLVSAPILSVNTLAANCYQSMFQDCTSLTSAPVLLATTLAANCYQSMFQGCTNLTSVPILPATELTDGCYKEMFKDCSNLKKLAVLLNQWQSTTSATENWVDGVSSQGMFFCLENLDIKYGNNNVPNGWDICIPDYLCFTANEDNSTITLIKGVSTETVYLRYKVNDGEWKNYEYGTTIKPNKQDKVYFSNVAFSNGFSSGEGSNRGDGYHFILNGSIAASGNIMSLIDATCSTLEIPNNHCFAGLFRGCKSLTTSPDLPATTLKESCYDCLFYGCENLKTVPKLPATEMQIHCYQSMFQLCKNIVDAPELPATTLVEGCYKCMFEDCISLKSLKVGFKEWWNQENTDNATGVWMKNINTNGVFYCSDELMIKERGENRIPSSWEIATAFEVTANQDPKHPKNYYSTFYSETDAFQVPDGVTAYTGKVESSASDPTVSVLKLTKIEDGIIPAYEAVILKSTQSNTDAGQISYLLTETTETESKSTDNKLLGTVATKTLGTGDYALSLGQNGVGFYLWNGKQIGANKAYLHLDEKNSAKAFVFDFDEGTTTGIKNHQPSTINPQPSLYNLNGMRVGKGYKGIVIKNGKKVYQR